MAKQLGDLSEKEKRREILRKAELEINLAEREVKEWKMHRRESPKPYKAEQKSYETEPRSNTTSDILCRTPTRYSPINDPSSASPKLKYIEKRLKDLEDLRSYENEKHRKEIERLESLIDKMQQARQSEPKTDQLQNLLLEKTRELDRKTQEISELKSRLISESKKKQNVPRCTSQEAFERGQKAQNPNIPKAKKPLKSPKTKLKPQDDTLYWKTKAYELSTKYFVALKSLRQDLNKLKNDYYSELNNFKDIYKSLYKNARNLKKP
ncbi:hypothetical protein SteCoe_10578 [Stentor coeruleus]|uniref:Uncharacterized protein n=1 Tax=Stentor coeruleus TaxID=5963 RepID=A0A1R2CF60_9CILI|nr:hypothetical protein SteCoe_10578 [Stentor coeruleus]